MYKTQGIIIKNINSGETDRLLTVYTKDFGKLLLKAKAIRKKQAKLKGHLELFSYVHLMAIPTKSWPLITGAELIRGFLFLHRSLPALAASYYLAEIIDRLMIGPERDERIWNTILLAFCQLNKKEEDVRKIIKDFEIRIIEALGYGQQDKTALFIESLLGNHLKSRYFLQNSLNLVKY